MEQIFENQFGKVHKDRVTYYRGKGWFSGGSEEDVPLRHVTSVRYEVSRRWVLAIVLILIGFGVATGVGEIGGVLGGLILAAFGGLLMLGTPTVTVVTASGDREAMMGLPWKKQDPQDFVKALKKQLFEGTEEK